MVPFSRGRLRVATLSCILLTLATLSLFCRNQASSAQQLLASGTSNNHNPLFDRLDLSEEQCRSTFPDLFIPIDSAVARGKFELKRSPADYQGLIQACIRDNALHILTTSPALTPQIQHQRTSTLSQIHRALLTSPSLLPNITFAFTINDIPKNNSWGFARPNKNSNNNVWIMPLFAGWSWPKEGLGSLNAILRRITDVESEVSWEEKQDKVVWRGTVWFNPLGYPDLRKHLIATAQGEEKEKWADVAALNDTNALKIEDFCRYKYVVYTEGVSYSGRLPYHQACESVVIMAPMTWVTTSAVLIRPIWAGDLMGVDHDQKMRVDGAIPTVTSYKEANAIYVDPNFSNLESVVEFLREHPNVARQIARNQRAMVVGGGYLSVAAETCYWRALIEGWSRAAIVDEAEWGDLEGERYETWLLKEISSSKGGTRGKNDDRGGS